MADYEVRLTSVGLQKAADALAGYALNLTHLAVGDGVNNLNEGRTALVDERWRGSVNRVFRDTNNPHWVVIEARIPSTAGGWEIKEVGVIDEDGDLIAQGTYPATYKPLETDGSVIDLFVRVILEVNNEVNITLVIDGSVIPLDSQQEIIAPWDATETYRQGRSCVGTDGRLYRSRITANLNHDPNRAGWADYWELHTRDYTHEHSWTITGGLAQITNYYAALTPEGGAADDLTHVDLATVEDNQFFFIRNSDSANAITVKHGQGGQGQIITRDGTDLVLDDLHKLLLMRRQANEILVVSQFGDAWGSATGTATGTTGWYYGDASDGDKTVTGSETVPVGVEDAEFLISNFDNLTISAGATLTPEKRVRCWVAYVQGNCTIYGHLSMDSKGAAGLANDLQIEYGRLAYAAPYLSVDNVDVFNVPALSAEYGQPLLPGQTGQGGEGGCHPSHSFRAVNIQGTAYRGGSGQGAYQNGYFDSVTPELSGRGGNAQADSPTIGCGGGAGVPPGNKALFVVSPGWASAENGGPGGGGTIFLIVQGNLDIGAAGIISADGGAGGDATSMDAVCGGGGAGGGSVNVFYKGSLVNGGTVRAAGGAGGDAETTDEFYYPWDGGPGKDGSVRIVQVDQ